MENKIKRFLCLVMAFVMVFGMFPTNVLATGSETTDEAPIDEITADVEQMAEGDYVAQIGTQGYDTLSAAIAAVQNGETIKLLTDISEDVTITQKANVAFTIEGADNTYSGTMSINGTSKATNQNQGLTIKNLNFVVDGYGIYTGGKTYPRNITIEGCSFTGTDGENTDCGIYLRYAYDFTVKDCTADNLGYLVSSAQALTGFTAENLTITNTKYGIRLVFVNTSALFKNVVIEDAAIGVEIRNQASGTVTFEDCTIEADTNLRLTQVNNVTNVTKVKFLGENTMICTGENWLENNTPDYFAVTLDGDNDGADNVTVVVPVAYAAQIDGQGYETLADAIAAVKDGETIVLLKDNAEDVTIKQVADLSFTIDGTGKTYSGTITIDGSRRATGAETLTIQNVNFVAEGEWQSSILASKSTYVHNLTVDGCTFTGTDAKQAYGIRLYHSYNITVKNTSGTKLYDLVYAQTAVTGFAAENITVTDSGMGFMMPYASGDVSFKNVSIQASGAGIGIYNNNVYTATFEDCTIDAVPALWINHAKTDKVGKLIFKGTNDFGEGNWLTVEGQGTDVIVDLTDDANLSISNVTYDKGYYGVKTEGEVHTITKMDAVAKIGEQGYATLAAAIAAVQNGEIIELLKDNAEDVTIKQVADLSFTIDGANFTYSGTMTVDGSSRSTGKETLTIQNVNFVVDGYGIETKKSSLAHNITVDGCTFTGTDGDNYDYGICLRHAYNIVVKNTKGSNLFDLVYGNTSVTGFTAENVEVTDSSYGIVLAYMAGNATFKNVTTDVSVAGILFFNGSKGTATFEGCNIDAMAYEEKYAGGPVTLILNDADNTLNISGEKTDKLAIVLNKADATLTAVEDLNVTTSLEGETVVYENGVYKIGKPVAEIVGGKQYTSIQAAVDAAQDGDTVILLKDVELGNEDTVKNDAGYDVMVNVQSKSIVLNMAGYTIDVKYTDTANRLFAVISVADGAGLTVTGNGKIDVSETAFLSEDDTNVAYMFWKRGTTGYLTIENGTYRAVDLEDSMVYSNGDKIVTVEGGTWTLDTVGTGDNGSPWIFNTQGQNSKSIVVTGGTYNADVANQHWEGEVHIPDTHICEDNGDGTWTVHEGKYVAQNQETGKKYITVQQAIDAVQNGETIILLVDNDEDVTINQQKDLSFTIDGAGVTYSGTMTVNGTGYAKDQGQALTVKNVNFVVDSYGIYAYARNNYARNITVDGCTFTGVAPEDGNDYGVALRHVYNITVKNTTGSDLTDLVYGGGAVTGFTAENIEVDNSWQCVWLSYPTGDISFKNVKVTNSKNVGVGFYNQAKATITFEDCSIDKIAYTEKGTYAVTMIFNDQENILAASEANGKLTAVLNQVDATLTAREGLNVIPNEELAKSYAVVYENGIYRLGKIIAKNIDTGKLYMDLSDGLAEAVSGETVILLAETAEDLVLVPVNVTFDLNGHVVEAKNTLSFGVVMDTAETVGGIKIDSDTTKAFTKLQPENGGYLPIYDSTNGMYKFYKYTLVNGGYKKAKDNDNKIIFGIKILFENKAAYTLLADTANESCISLYLRITWTGLKGYDINHKISAGTIAKYANSVLNAAPGKSPAMTVSVEGISNLESGEFVKGAPWLTTLTEVAAYTEYDEVDQFIKE